MREWAAVLGAPLEIISQADVGTQIIVKWTPLT